MLEKMVLFGVTQEMMDVAKKWLEGDPKGVFFSSFHDFFVSELAASDRVDVFVNNYYIDRSGYKGVRVGGRMKYSMLRMNSPESIRKLLEAFSFKDDFNYLRSKAGSDFIGYDAGGRGGRFNIAVFNFFHKGREFSTIWWDNGSGMYWDRVPVRLQPGVDAFARVFKVLKGYIAKKGS